MAMGTREIDQPPLWIATSDLPASPGHPFYAQLRAWLDAHDVDRCVEDLCPRFYAPVMGRPGFVPGRYFRRRRLGYFEGIDAERGIAWRARDSLAVRRLLRRALDDAPPDHSTMSRTRRLIDLETHRAVFTWVQQRLAETGLRTGKTVAIDATTLEANAAMRSIVRRDTGERDQECLTRLAQASGIDTPTREDLARLDRTRKTKTSNTEWTNPYDPDAKVAKMKDGRTHLAHNAEPAVDLDTGAMVAVTLQGADPGDTTTVVETATAAAEQVEDAQAAVTEPQPLEAIIADKGYHSHQTMVDLDAVGIRSSMAEPDRGPRDWSEAPEAHAPVYGHRRRIRGRRVLVDDCSDAHADGVLPFDRAARDHASHVLQFSGRGVKKRLALVCPQLGQLRVSTRHESFAGKIRMRDFEQVALVEQAELDAPPIDELSNGAGPEGRNPIDALSLLEFLNLLLRNHPAIAHEDELFDREGLLQFLDLRHQGLRVAGVPFEHGHGDRATPRVGEQAVVDLELAALAIAVVPERGQRACRAFKVT